MSTAKAPRTDVHSASNLITENYTYIVGLDTRPHEDDTPDLDWRESAREHGEAVDAALYAWDGTCRHCGTRGLRWVAVLRHTSGEYIVVGFQCLDNRFARATEDFKRLKRQGELDRQLQRVKAARLAWLAAHPDLAFLGTGELPAASTRNSFLQDLSFKLRKNGELSEKQADAARASLVRDIEFAAQKAAEAAKKAAARGGEALPCPTGRIQITGTILSVKEVEDKFAYQSRYSDYVPTITKIVVEDDRGFRVYGTAPSGLRVDRGVRISFAAAIEPSRNDAGFGFYKRPTKAALIEAAS